VFTFCLKAAGEKSVIEQKPENINANNQRLHVVLELLKPKKLPSSSALTGPDLAANLKIGTRVVRGVDWKWGDQVLLLSYVNVNTKPNGIYVQIIGEIIFNVKSHSFHN
jgi:hypothetical protein